MDRLTIPALKEAIEKIHIPDNDTFKIEEKDFREAHNDVIDTLSAMTSGNFINTTYTQLLEDVDEGNLSVGSWYIFQHTPSFRLSSTLDSSNLSTGYKELSSVGLIDSTYERPLETLAVFSTGIDKLSTKALSLDFPTDEITYHLKGETFGVLGSTGQIVKRKCTKYNVECGFDFRTEVEEVKVLSDSLVSDHSAMLDSGGSPNSTGYLLSPSFLDVQSGFKVKFVPKNLQTINNTSLNTSSSFYVKCIPTPSQEVKNIKIETKYTSLEVVAGGSIGGQAVITNTPVLLSNAAKNISIGLGSSSIVLSGERLTNIKIGNNNNSIALGGATSLSSTSGELAIHIFNVSIGDGNKGLYLTAFRDSSIGDRNKGILTLLNVQNSTIGNDNVNLVTGSLYRCNIGNFNVDTSILQTGDFKLGNNNESLILFSVSGYIGNGNDTIDLKACQEVSIGDANTNIYAIGGHSTKIGNENLDIVLVGTSTGEITIGSYNSIVEIQGGDLTLGNSNNNIRIEGSSTTIGNGNDNIILIDPVTEVTLGDRNSYVFVYNYTNVIIGNDNTSIGLSGNSNSDVIIGNFNTFLQVFFSSEVVIENYNNSISIGFTPIIFNLTSLSIPTDTLICNSRTTFSAFGTSLIYNKKTVESTHFLQLGNYSTNSQLYVSNINSINVGNNNIRGWISQSGTTVKNNVDNFYMLATEGGFESLDKSKLLVNLSYSFTGNKHIISCQGDSEVINSINLREYESYESINDINSLAVITLEGGVTTSNFTGMEVLDNTGIVINENISGFNYGLATISTPDDIEITLQSPDGSFFYPIISDTGVLTYNKIQ